MRKRVLIGIALIAGLGVTVAVDLLLSYPLMATLAVTGLTLLAARELVVMLRGGPCPVVPLVLAVIAAMFALRALSHGRPGWPDQDLLTIVVLSAGTFLILVQGVLRMQRQAAPDASRYGLDAVSGVFALAYVGVPLGFLQAVALEADPGGGEGTLFLAVLVFIAKCGDIGGYLLGTVAGRRRVLPAVSPKKTWEGSFGGLVLTVAAVFLARELIPGWLGDFQPGTALLFAVLVNVAVQAGDFAESMIKRSCGVKDSGAILPTFGGALDIIDSLVFAIPMAYIFFQLAR